MADFLKADKIQVLTLASRDKELESQTLPFLRFLLENKSEFVMSMIPRDIAIAISMHISGTEVNDSRLRIHDLVGELALVEKVEIDSVIPGTGVYQATITVTPEGFSNSLSFQMIPSNATLLAVINDAPIYISSRLWEEYIESKDSFSIEVEGDDFLDDPEEEDFDLEDFR